jgi:hypothetical protein
LFRKSELLHINYIDYIFKITPEFSNNDIWYVYLKKTGNTYDIFDAKTNNNINKIFFSHSFEEEGYSPSVIIDPITISMSSEKKSDIEPSPSRWRFPNFLEEVVVVKHNQRKKS